MHKGSWKQSPQFSLLCMSMHDSVSIFKDHLRFSETQTKLDQRQDRWMGILQDYDQEKEYNSGGKNQLAAALQLVGRIKFLKPECVVNAVTTAADSDSCMQREGRVFPRSIVFLRRCCMFHSCRSWEQRCLLKPRQHSAETF